VHAQEAAGTRKSRWIVTTCAWFIVDSSLVGYDGGQYARDEDQKVEQELKPHGRSFVRALVPDWRPTREQKLWAVRIILVLVVLLGTLTLVGLPFDVTLWDWLDLLIVPIVLALGGYLFTRSENRRALDVANQQRPRPRDRRRTPPRRHASDIPGWDVATADR